MMPYRPGDPAYYVVPDTAPDTEPPPSQRAHEWVTIRDLPACRLCGVVRRADDRNAPCPGAAPKVEPR